MKELRRTGLGTRVFNFVVDTAVIFLISYLLYKWRMFYVLHWGSVFVPFYIFFYATLFVYYFLFELIFARTPGKWLSLSRVVSNKGRRPNVLAIFLRSLLRLTIIDAFFFPFWEMTLHDKLSSTEVVES